MGRPASIPADTKRRIVLSVLAGEASIAELASREKVSEQSIGRWKADFLCAGRTALAAGRSGPSTREQQLEAEGSDLAQALVEAHVQLRVGVGCRDCSSRCEHPFHLSARADGSEALGVQALLSSHAVDQDARQSRSLRIRQRRRGAHDIGGIGLEQRDHPAHAGCGEVEPVVGPVGA